MNKSRGLSWQPGKQDREFGLLMHEIVGSQPLEGALFIDAEYISKHEKEKGGGLETMPVKLVRLHRPYLL